MYCFYKLYYCKLPEMFERNNLLSFLGMIHIYSLHVFIRHLIQYFLYIIVPTHYVVIEFLQSAPNLSGRDESGMTAAQIKRILPAVTKNPAREYMLPGIYVDLHPSF